MADTSEDSPETPLLTLDDVVGRATLSVEETARLLGVKRSAAYTAVRRGQLPSIPVGRRLVVPVPRLLELLGVQSSTDESDDAKAKAGGRSEGR